METTKVDKDAIFYIMKDGKGMEHKIINLDNPKICPREGVIEIEAFKKQNLERSLDYNVKIGTIVDKKTGIIWGIPVGINKTSGDIMFQKITLKTQTYFDRSIEGQAKQCAIVLNSKIVEGSPNLPANSRPTFKVRNKEEQAKKNLDKKALAVQAYEIASKLYGEELRDIARNLGIMPDAYSETVLSSEVVERAFANPDVFMSVWKDPNREFVTILKKACECNIIENNLQIGYLYNGFNLGKTEGQAVHCLKEKPDLAASIAVQTKARKEESLKAMQTPVYRTLSNVIPAEKEPVHNDELAELRKQNQMLMELLQKQNAKPVEQVTEPAVGDEDEMKALRKRANDLKIPGANAPKMKKETLLAKIAEAEAAVNTPEM